VRIRKQVYTAKKKRWSRNRYERRFQNGLCPLCGGKRTGEWITCITCREKLVARAKARPEAKKETNRKAIIKYRIKCRKQGICYGCGRYVGLEGYKLCEGCRKKNRDASRRRYGEKIIQSILREGGK